MLYRIRIVPKSTECYRDVNLILYLASGERSWWDMNNADVEVDDDGDGGESDVI